MDKATEIADAKDALNDVCPAVLRDEIKADIKEAKRQIARLTA